MFISFIFVNGSIVVGDKSAHEAGLHLPQVGLNSFILTSPLAMSIVTKKKLSISDVLL